MNNTFTQSKLYVEFNGITVVPYAQNGRRGCVPICDAALKANARRIEFADASMKAVDLFKRRDTSPTGRYSLFYFLTVLINPIRQLPFLGETDEYYPPKSVSVMYCKTPFSIFLRDGLR